MFSWTPLLDAGECHKESGTNTKGSGRRMLQCAAGATSKAPAQIFIPASFADPRPIRTPQRRKSGVTTPSWRTIQNACGRRPKAASLFAGGLPKAKLTLCTERDQLAVQRIDVAELETAGPKLQRAEIPVDERAQRQFVQEATVDPGQEGAVGPSHREMRARNGSQQ